MDFLEDRPVKGSEQATVELTWLDHHRTRRNTTPTPPGQAVAHRARHPGKSSGLVRSGDRFDAHRAFEFVKAYQALYPVTTLCRVLGVSSSGYYAWRRRRPSARRQGDALLQAHIEAIHAWSDGTYGTPRIWAQLRQEGVHVGAKRVARLLRQAGLQGVSLRPRTATTRRAKDQRPVSPQFADLFLGLAQLLYSLGRDWMSQFWDISHT